jgi:formylglycine-generating enzyme required for sulfatase activity
MKKAIKALFVIILIILTVSGALAAENKKTKTLKAGASDMNVSGAPAAEKENKIEIKTVDNYIAIFDFEVTTGDKGISRPLADSVIHEFSQSDKYEVIDRGNMNKILGEQKFQISGCVAQECKVEAGQILGVGKIVSGSVGLVVKTYYLTLQLIDVKTGKVDLAAEDKCKCEVDELLDSTKRLAKRLLGEKVEEPAVRAPEPAVVAKPAGPEPRITNSIGMTFVYIKPGTFMMGSPLYETGRDNDETQHQVTLTKGFYMGETEVTVGQWRTFARDSGYRTEAETGGGAFVNISGKWEKKEGYYWDNPGFAQSENHPVTCVSWNDAQAFIRWINSKEGADYRLPTEAEWEYAARAGTQMARFWGEDPDQACDYANVADHTEWSGRKWNNPHNCRDGHWFTAPVGSFRPNPWGLYDMIGNVWEWCQDWKGDYPTSSVTDPTGPYSGSNRVNRGGSWGNFARTAVRLIETSTPRRAGSTSWAVASPAHICPIRFVYG